MRMHLVDFFVNLTIYMTFLSLTGNVKLLYTYFLLMIRDNTPHKVRVGVVECRHEPGELLLVRLAYSVEHSLPRARRSESRLAHNSSSHAHDLSCKQNVHGSLVECCSMPPDLSKDIWCHQQHNSLSWLQITRSEIRTSKWAANLVTADHL